LKIIHVETVLSKPHLETSGEIALRLKEDINNIVKFVYLGKNLAWSDWEFAPFLKTLGLSFDKRLKLFKDILKESEVEVLEENNFDCFEKDSILAWSKKFKGDLNELKNLKYENISIGKTVLSSLISYFRDFNFNINAHRTKVQQMLYNAAIILKRTELLIKYEKPDQIVTFNGRFSVSYPIIAVAEKFRIQVLRHERGSNFDKFEIFKKNIHDYKYRYYLAKRYWAISKKNKNKIGHSYFTDKIKKKNTGSDFGFNYTQHHQNKYLNFNIKNKKLVVFYTSSDYETAAFLHDYNQEKKFKLLYSAISKLKNIHLIIRVHPDVKKKNIKEDFKWKKYSSNFCTVLESDDKSDSYALLKVADIVMGYTSSMLIEALYWKKKVYTLSSKNIYYYSKAIKLIGPKYKILKILNQKYKLKKKYLDKCLLFGYYYKTYGIKFKYYIPQDFYNGKLMNQNLEWKNKIILCFEKIGLKFIYYFFKDIKYK
jgi:UDP-N-acetylglucosamine 2-epimerase